MPLTIDRVPLLRAVVLAAVTVTAGLTGGCREDQSNRPLSFEPGVFQGDKIPELTADQRKNLQDRGTLQK